MSRGWDCGHHGTAVEDRGGIVRACCDILWVSLSADVVVRRLLVILVGIRGACCAGCGFFLAKGSEFGIEGCGGVAEAVIVTSDCAVEVVAVGGSKCHVVVIWADVAEVRGVFAEG